MNPKLRTVLSLICLAIIPLAFMSGFFLMPTKVQTSTITKVNVVTMTVTNTTTITTTAIITDNQAPYYCQIWGMSSNGVWTYLASFYSTSAFNISEESNGNTVMTISCA